MLGKSITVNNSLEHIVVYGYFQHAFEYYLKAIKGKEVPVSEVSEMLPLFIRIRSKLTGGGFHAPSVLDSVGSIHRYPMEIGLSNEEYFWFLKIIVVPFNKLYKRTSAFFGKKKPDQFYSDLLNNLRTDQAIEYLRKEFLKRNILN